MALDGARVGHQVWVAAPEGMWASTVLEIDGSGVLEES